MSMVHLRLALDKDEYAMLLEAADQELRGPADEVRFILRQEFQRRRLVQGGRVSALSTDLPQEDADVQSGGANAPR